MSDFYVKVGDSSSFSKTVGETDVYLFAGITGDFSPNHTNKAYMEKSSYGRLQAHGALQRLGYVAMGRGAKAGPDVDRAHELVAQDCVQVEPRGDTHVCSDASANLTHQVRFAARNALHEKRAVQHQADAVQVARLDQTVDDPIAQRAIGGQLPFELLDEPAQGLASAGRPVGRREPAARKGQHRQRFAFAKVGVRMNQATTDVTERRGDEPTAGAQQREDAPPLPGDPPSERLFIVTCQQAHA